ncbi:hypothetical protein KCQ_12875 [Pectobacterium atrosepticum ICMP 1526]|nr:hypothetical protein KCQ_12875 [Pectobacterium atrosepticum ICMP 1526]
MLRQQFQNHIITKLKVKFDAFEMEREIILG